MVSVVIPAFDEVATVGDCIAVALEHPDVVEVIVVDDGSTDRTAEVARAAGARVLQLERMAARPPHSKRACGQRSMTYSCFSTPT